MFIKDLSILLNAFGAGNFFIMAFAMLRHSKANHKYAGRILAGLFFVIGVITLNTVFNYSGYSQVFPLYEPFSNALGFLLAPLMFLYLQGSNTRKGKDLIHFSIALFFIILTLVSFFIESTIKESLIAVYTNQLIFVIWNIHFAVYVILSYLLLRNQTGSIRLFDQFLFYGVSLVWFLNLILFIYESNFGTVSILLRLNITLLFFVLSIVLVYHRFFATGDIRRKTKGRSISEDSDSDQALLLNDIKENIEQKKYYQEPGLDIRSLSQHLALPYHELSRIINDESGMNFNDFINEFRINEVVTNLEGNQHVNLTIMGLAERAGFKSASSFYAAFKKVMGTTPKNYLKTISQQ